MAIPIVIGVTAHRNPRPEDLPRLRELVDAELKKLKEACPHSPLYMLNALAEGGDALCADAAIALGIPLIVPLPFALEEYRKDFEGEALAVFDRQIACAKEVFVSPDLEGEGRTDRNYGYRQAGFFCAERAQILLALWNGQAAQPDGCGAAEAADRFLLGTDPLRHRSAELIQIVTPRQGQPLPEDALSVRRTECGPIPAAETLQRIDEFNARIPETEGISGHCAAADRLAMQAQKGFFSTILTLAILCAALVFAFLGYDSLESGLWLPVHAVVLLCAWAVLRRENRRLFHADFLRYRNLSETLRVQGYLLSCGIRDVNVADFYTWTQITDLAWLREGLNGLLLMEKPDEEDPISPDDWFRDQLAYHRRAIQRKGKQHRANERLCSILTAVSVLIFLSIFLLECFLPAFMESPLPVADGVRRFFLMHEGDLPMRSLFKVGLGVVSTAALFLSSYYGRLSLGRQIEDHKKMASLYQAAHDAPVKDRALCVSLAREEVIENGNWLSYMKENTPGIDL